MRPDIGGSSASLVATLNASGAALIYATHLGGSGYEQGYGIAVDPAGNAYVTGSTESLNFPTAHPLQPAYGGSGDAFVAKLNASGSALVYSTYLGGSGYELGSGIAAGRAGRCVQTW